MYVEFYTKIAPNHLKKSENEARIARYEFFEEALENFDADARVVARSGGNINGEYNDYVTKRC